MWEEEDEPTAEHRLPLELFAALHTRREQDGGEEEGLGEMLGYPGPAEVQRALSNGLLVFAGVDP